MSVRERSQSSHYAITLCYLIEMELIKLNHIKIIILNEKGHPHVFDRISEAFSFDINQTNSLNI